MLNLALKFILSLSVFISGTAAVAEVSEQELLSRARIALNYFDYETALHNVNLLLYRNSKNDEAQQLGIVAYSGRAGLRPWELLSSLNDIGESTYFRVMAEHFPKADQRTLHDLEAALSLVEARRANGIREDILELVVTIGTLGATLRRYAYGASGALKKDFDACSAETLPDPAVQDIVLNFSRMLGIADFAQVGPDLSPLTSSPIVSQFRGVLDVDCSNSNSYILCSSMRSVVNEGAERIGLGSGVLSVCH